MANREDLIKEYRRLAKQADQRLVRIEAASHEEHYRGLKTFSYKKAIRDIESWSGQGARRFNTRPPENIQSLQAKISDIKSFLESPTSSKSAITKMYKQKTETLNKNYGTNFTWQEMATYFEKADAGDVDLNIKGSKTLIAVLNIMHEVTAPAKGKQQKQKDLTRIDAINKYKDQVDHVDASKVDKTIAKRLLDQGLTYEDLFMR